MSDSTNAFAPSLASQPKKSRILLPHIAHSANAIRKKRIRKACNNCHNRKVKCSGDYPICQRCRDERFLCGYRNEEAREEPNHLIMQIHELTKLLRNLSPWLDSSSAYLLDQTLNQMGSPLRIHDSVFMYSARRPLNRIALLQPSLKYGNPINLADPVGMKDYTEEDFHQNGEGQGMGFVGEHSEIAWLCRLKQDLDQTISASHGKLLYQPFISSANYYQEDNQILIGEEIDPMKQPPQQTADRLVAIYFYYLHSSFPIIGELTFLNQYRSFRSDSNARPGRRWVAILNLVFAIASRHEALLVHTQSKDYLHPAYFARAWKLTMGSTAVLEQQSLQSIQIYGLLGLYFFSTGQVNRSWKLTGMAIQSAITMGLHLRNECRTIHYMSKEIRYRLWWALFILDIELSVITGRAPTTCTTFCTTPLPLPLDEPQLLDTRFGKFVANQTLRNAMVSSLLCNGASTKSRQIMSGETDFVHVLSTTEGTTNKDIENIRAALVPNNSLCFLYMVDLASLLQEVLNTLHAPGAARRSWAELALAIHTFDKNAEDWRSRLPDEFDIRKSALNQQFARQRTRLAFQFYTTKLIISQPCLRLLSRFRLSPDLPDTACKYIAQACVATARHMLELLPTKPDMSWLLEISPWWCILHYTMQPTAILLIELFTHTQPDRLKAAELFEYIQKATCWLGEISITDRSSRRAWLLCMGLIARHGSQIGLKVDPTWNGTQ
ncbi:unnamed protein product [Penicillium salamii]|nr:unnamed protein product [Penicillium salamii]CAG8238108.1 unnamed protein product [Penicillium salamii]